MNNKLKEWSTGVFALILITFTIYSINRFVFPANYYNLLEWFGIVMILVILKTGVDSSNEKE